MHKIVVDEESRGWGIFSVCVPGGGIDRQVRKKLQIPGGVPWGGMVTGRIEPRISGLKTQFLNLISLSDKDLNGLLKYTLTKSGSI